MVDAEPCESGESLCIRSGVDFGSCRLDSGASRRSGELSGTRLRAPKGTVSCSSKSIGTGASVVQCTTGSGSGSGIDSMEESSAAGGDTVPEEDGIADVNNTETCGVFSDWRANAAVESCDDGGRKESAVPGRRNTVLGGDLGAGGGGGEAEWTGGAASNCLGCGFVCFTGGFFF